MTQETETLALREYFRCGNREEGRNGTLGRREKKGERICLGRIRETAGKIMEI